MKYSSTSQLQILDYQHKQEFHFSTEEGQGLLLHLLSRCYWDMRESIFNNIILMQKSKKISSQLADSIQVGFILDSCIYVYTHSPCSGSQRLSGVLLLTFMYDCTALPGLWKKNQHHWRYSCLAPCRNVFCSSHGRLCLLCLKWTTQAVLS